MRMTPHDVQAPTWTESDYGEDVAVYSSPVKVPMFIGWSSEFSNDDNGSHYSEYELVGITRAHPADGSLVDGKYIVGHVETGRLNRVFMTYAEGTDRDV